MILKIIIIILIIIIFYIYLTNNIEKFINLYRTPNEFPWEYNEIYSSIPIDIKLKNNKDIMYEYGNDEFETKIKQIFNNNNSNNLIAIAEGVEWSNWMDPKESDNKNKLYEYYSKIFNYINKTLKETNIIDLPNDTNKVKIITQKFIRYKIDKQNPNFLLFDLDFVLYRNKKPLGKHFKFLVISDNINIYIINAKLIGVINEYNLKKSNISGDILNKNYSEFIPEKYVKQADPELYIYSGSDKLLNSSIEYKLYNKLLKDL